MLSSVNHNKAESWPNTPPGAKNDTSDQTLMSKDFSSDVILPDSLPFKSDNQFDTELEDRLSSSFKEGIEKQAREVEENAENKQIGEIFEFDENVVLNENIPGISMNFLDQLFYQLKEPSTLEEDHEDFTEIDEVEITAVINDNTEIDKNKSKDQSSFMKIVRSFFKDLHDETNVICGISDEDALLKRRSSKAKSSLLPEYNNQISSF